MGTPEFPGLGRHCSVPDCKQIDFLPFSCDACNKVFCLQHRSYVEHRCPDANQNDVTVLVCPLCAKSVMLVPKEDPNITWEHHVNIDCDPSNFQRSKKKRCPVPGCKELLTFSNTVRCRDCIQDHCLKHRFGSDHRCPGPKKLDSNFQFVNLFRKSQKQAMPRPSSDSSSWWGSSVLNAASSFRASAESGMSRLGNATNQALQKAKDVIGQNSSSGSPTEQCPHCQEIFYSINTLIEHVERFHNRNAERVHQRVVTIDVCPKCSKGFQDPVLLVEHVERDHGGTSTA